MGYRIIRLREGGVEREDAMDVLLKSAELVRKGQELLEEACEMLRASGVNMRRDARGRFISQRDRGGVYRKEWEYDDMPMNGRYSY